MIVLGYQKIIAPDGVINGVSMLTRLGWTLRGFVQSLRGTSLPYGIGDWYWIPSRIIPAPGDVEPITEFPFFTALYGDPHAHFLALPIALLALAVCSSIIFSGGRWRGIFNTFIGLLFAGIAFGALRPTNTWDFYPYLLLGIFSMGYALWMNNISFNNYIESFPILKFIPIDIFRVLRVGAGIAILTLLSFVLYQPYEKWYALGYTQINLWEGTHTPLDAYLIHWGLFLFIIFSWMVWETREWMANTPASSLRKLVPFRSLIIFCILIAIIAIVVLIWLEVSIVWFVIPLALWAGILFINPAMPDNKRFVLLLVASGLLLTLMVEIIVLRGDIGRMNTVFKFYLQVWTFLAISAAAAFGWTLKSLSKWLPGWRNIWSVVLVILIFGAALYPLMASMAKIKDRMTDRAPHSLDGMAFMEYAYYSDRWGVMDLSQDYYAIRWLQENVIGSPVIVEANLRNLYHWGSRFTNFTGLPGVVGWEWHQQQQRAVVPGHWISDRIAEVDDFYLTTDLQSAVDFLRKYDVRYIILGQQERGHYPGPGLEKFSDAEGIFWDEVYHQDDTVIYKVITQ